ncbi:MAG: flagellar biosynthesis protein FlgH [Planctomycetota bacterium]|nr:MAG: flagellar biosynthesis protein FlgH [Planctomycetota bacterium]
MRFIQFIAAALWVALNVSAATAQDSSLLQATPHGAPQDGPALSLQNGSYIFREVPADARPRELQKHDTLIVLVDYRTRTLSEGDAENRKTSSLTAVLSSWIRFDGKSLKAAPQNDGDPRVAGTYNSQYRTESDIELRDTLSFRIGAEIIDVRPNGNLYIEGNQVIRVNEEEWRLFVSGEVSRDSIQPDRTVSSDAIVNGQIVKEETGQVRDGYQRGWFTKWYDKYKPF